MMQNKAEIAFQSTAAMRPTVEVFFFAYLHDSGEMLSDKVIITFEEPKDDHSVSKKKEKLHGLI